MLAITVGGNAAAVHSALSKMATQLPVAVEKGEKAVATAVLLSTTRAMEELIYEAPLPSSYADFGLEERTGALLAGEAMLPSEGGWVITTENSGLAGKDPTEYAEWRHGYRKYPAPWRTEGLERIQGELPQIFEEALAPALLRND